MSILTKLTILNVKIYYSFNHYALWSKFFGRKTVIVWNTFQNEREVTNVEEVEDFKNIDFGCSLTILEIENIYTMEEETNFKNLISTFYENWKAISYGPEIMGSYINFCQNPRTLPTNYLKENHKVTRYTFISYIILLLMHLKCLLQIILKQLYMW